MSLDLECLPPSLGSIQDSKGFSRVTCLTAGFSIPCPVWALLALCGCVGAREIHISPVSSWNTEQFLGAFGYQSLCTGGHH